MLIGSDSQALMTPSSVATRHLKRPLRKPCRVLSREAWLVHAGTNSEDIIAAYRADVVAADADEVAVSRISLQKVLFPAFLVFRGGWISQEIFMRW